MASELTPDLEQEIRTWLILQDSLYIKGGVWHSRKREDHHIRAAAMVAEIDRLRISEGEIMLVVESQDKRLHEFAAEIDRLRQRVTNLEDIETDDQEEIDRLRAELAIVEQENKEVRAGAERECDRLRAALKNAHIALNHVGS